MERYFQQMIVPELGPEGQQKLATTRVLIVGSGGLGTPVATYLAAAGIGKIGLIDGDKVAESNLARQFYFTTQELDQSKALILARKLLLQNPSIEIVALEEMLNEANAPSIIEQYDIVCDCTDRVDSRILIDKTCGEFEKPLIYAAVKDWEAYISVFHHKRKMKLASVFSYESLAKQTLMNCTTAGIINSTCGIAGSIQATEVLKIIAGMESELDGGILCIDMRVPVFRVFNLNIWTADIPESVN
jgi:molybdopterin/thiamine biosynthesis adenylyltransferase